MFEIPDNPELEDILRAQFRKQALELRTNTIGRVITYDPATQRAEVSVEILPVYRADSIPKTPANPNPTVPGKPIVLSGVPVAWPRTSSGYLTFPLAPGDTGELRVQDRDASAWLTKGTPCDPVAAWTHRLSSAVFCPCVWSSTNPIVPPTDASAVVLEGTLIKLGVGAADFVALATKVLAELQKIQTWANSHIHTAPPGGGSTTSPVSPLDAPDPVSATKVQAE